MSRAVSPAEDECPPSLLHNIGGAPYATLTWCGMTPDAASGRDATESTGAWVYFRHILLPSHPLYGGSWNTSRALLKLIEPDHALPEEEARTHLLQRIEVHCASLVWPDILMATPIGVGESPKFVLDHPLTVFVAMAKSTGNIWMSDLPIRLAPLHSPRRSEGSSGGMFRCTQWGCKLWFPRGIPANLLQATQKRRDNKSAPAQSK